MDFLFKTFSSFELPLKEEGEEPHLCQKCGNRHVGEVCAARPCVFEWRGNCQQVYLVGEWSQWQYYEPLKKVNAQEFQITKNLMAGIYRYKFIVDKNWVHDQSKPTVPDNFGGLNNIREIQPMNANKETGKNQTGEPCIPIQTSIKGKEIKIIGSWDNWDKAEVMKPSYNHLKNHEQFVIYKNLLPETKYEFKLLMDGEIVTDPEYPLLNSPNGLANWIVPSSELSGNQRESDKSLKLRANSFNPTQFIWKRQAIEWFPYYNIYGHKMCVVGDHLYVVGGVSRGSTKNLILKISLDTFECLEKWCFEGFQERAFPILKPYGNKLLIFGGVSNNLNLLEDYVTFNTSTNQICPHPKIRGTPPSKREKNSCVILGDMMVFFGGCSWEFDGDQYQLYNDVSILDIHEMKWIEDVNPEGAKPKPRYGHSATLYDDYMYIFGGCVDIANEVSDNEIWRLKLVAHQKPVWEQVKTTGIPPSGRYGHTANLMGDHYIAIFGGINTQKPMNDLFLLNLKTLKWIRPDILGGIPQARHFHHSCTSKEGEVIVLGGKTGKGKNQAAYVLTSNLEGVQLNL